jgi:hypothetical protein
MIGRLPFRGGLVPTPISAAELALNVYRRIPKVISTSYLNELVQPAAGPKGPGAPGGHRRPPKYRLALRRRHDMVIPRLPHHLLC